LTLGIRDLVSDEKIWLVLNELGIQAVVEKSEKGLDSLLNEEVHLSGGEEQILVVARIILQNRKFIIFDEGVNQLDVEKEALVLKKLAEMARKGAGVLFITHRITTAKKADKICFLKNGQIFEEGTHELLLQKGGDYADFWKMQVVD
jgi:ATP-binding cassette subfamily B protein